MRWIVPALSLLTALTISGAVQAQAAKTYVSGVGDDANACTRTAPCKSFSSALTKTTAGGEITCLDSGGYGFFTIDKSISINCDAAKAEINAASTTGIVIGAASTDLIHISGLELEGFGTGFRGIQVLAAGSVTIRNTTIRGFQGDGASGTGAGISVQANTGTVRLVVDNVTISDNDTVAGVPNRFGISLETSFAATVDAFINNTVVTRSGIGLRVVTPAGASGSILASVTHSAFYGHRNSGVVVSGGGSTARVSLRDVTVARNGFGVRTAGTTGSVFMAATQISDNTTGLSGNLIFSFGDNYISQNGSDGPAPTIVARR